MFSMFRGKKKVTAPSVSRLDVFDALKGQSVGLIESKEEKNRPLEEQLEHWHEQGVAVVSGSTHIGKKRDFPEGVSHATAARKYTDEDGVVNRSVLVMVSSNTHPPDDVQKEVADYNKDLLTAFDEELASPTYSGNLTETFKAVGGSAPYGTKGSSMAAAVVTQDANGRMRYNLANVGNIVAVVFDGNDLQVKRTIIPASPVKTGHPLAVHSANQSPDAIQSASSFSKPGDVIVLLTREVFNTLPLNFTNLPLSPQRSASQMTEHEIAQAIIENVEAKMVEKRQKHEKAKHDFTQWMTKRQAQIKTYREQLEKTIPEKQKDRYQMLEAWGYYQEETHKNENDPSCSFDLLMTELNAHKPYLALRFPTEENIEKDTSLYEKGLFSLMDNLDEAMRDPSFEEGDCATVAVMRVLDPTVELVRALYTQTDPAKCKTLVNRLATQIKNKMEEKPDAAAYELKEDTETGVRTWRRTWREHINDAKNKLKAEMRIAPRSRGKADSIVKYPVYRPKQFDGDNDAARLIQQAEQLAFVESLKGLSLADREAKFKVFTTQHHLIHKNKKWDSLVGKKNTDSWGEAMKQMRQGAWTQLQKELEGKNLKQKEELLGEAHEMFICKKHRYDSIFRGGFGRTTTLRKIDDELDKIRKEKKRTLKKS